jgi:hypothetical protein
MTKQERNTYILLAGAGAVAFYLINKGNQERARREQIRQQQLLNQQNRGGGGGRILDFALDLFAKRKERKANKGKSNGKMNGLTLPDIDLNNLDTPGGFNINATTTEGMATNLGLDPNAPFGIDTSGIFTNP